MGVYDFFNKKKKEEVDAKEETVDNVIDRLYDGYNEVFSRDDIRSYVDGAFDGFQQMEKKMKASTPIPEMKSDDIDKILDEYNVNLSALYSVGQKQGTQETRQANLDMTVKKLHTYFNIYGYEEVMQKYKNTNYKKYSIIDLEKELIGEKDDFLLKLCREELYRDDITQGMYLSGKDNYQTNRMFVEEMTQHKGKGYWLERRLMQQNAIENAHFTSESIKADVLEEAQISWKRSDTGLRGMDVEKTVKEIFAQDFDKGYWVQTELEILTLPVEEKQEIRKFREQNRKDGLYFEPGTLINQYAESTGKNFEASAGSKK